MQQVDEQLERDLQTLSAAASRWARLAIEPKIQILRDVSRSVYRVAPQWVEAAAAAKGLRHDSPLYGEEWISGPWAVLYALTRYLRTLESIARHGRPRLPPVRRRGGGQIVLDVFPHDLYDRILLSGVRAEVWMQPGLTLETVQNTVASFYREPAPEGRVVLILGAGNISSIAPLDVLYKMIARGAVCILKMNPVNAYLAPIFQRAFAPLIEGGFLRFAHGDAAAGAYLCTHESVDEIHITGSAQTHDAIVAKAGGKPITSELGNVSPTIVVPGPWNARDLQFQAEHIATQKAHNAGFNCVASQVLVLPAAWEHTQALLSRICRVFERMEQRPEYYPGAKQRRESFGVREPGLRTLTRIDPRDTANPAFSTEAFCGVLAYVEMPGDLDRYLNQTVCFSNNVLHGTLGANLIVHPRTMRRYANSIDAAVQELRYGCVGVNAWTGVGYFLTETPWGAFPGHTPADAGSGIGVVHNSYLLEGTEKSVVYAPFAPFPKPPWFVTNAMAAKIGRALCDFEVSRTPANAAKIAALALRA